MTNQCVGGEGQTVRSRKSASEIAIAFRDKAVPTQVYFVETDCAERHIKIGVAANVRARMGKMQMDCPYTLRLLKRVPGAAHIEKEAHERFAAARIGGEWFRRSAALLAFIDGLDGLTGLETDLSTKAGAPPRFRPFDPTANTVRATEIRPGVRNLARLLPLVRLAGEVVHA